MATPPLVHAGVELVVASAVTFWLNRKIKRLSRRVTLLDDKVKYYEQLVNQHHTVLKNLCKVGIRPASAEAGSRAPLSKPDLSPISPPSAPPSPPPVPSTPLTTFAAPVSPDSSNVEPPIVIELTSSNDLDSTNLDSILVDEISDLKAQMLIP